MSKFTQKEISEMLEKLRGGDQKVLDQLMPIMYDELHRIASQLLHKEYRKHTLQTTELVHEAYIRLVGNEPLSWQNRAHFFGIAASAMRQILVDYARKRKAAKRGKGKKPITLNEVMLLSPDNIDELLALDEALTRLKTFDERQSRIVEMRYFTGLTIEETAEVLAISPATVKREWNLAKAWLYRELSAESKGDK